MAYVTGCGRSLGLGPSVKTFGRYGLNQLRHPEVEPCVLPWDCFALSHAAQGGDPPESCLVILVRHWLWCTFSEGPWLWKIIPPHIERIEHIDQSRDNVTSSCISLLTGCPQRPSLVDFISGSYSPRPRDRDSDCDPRQWKIYFTFTSGKYSDSGRLPVYFLLLPVFLGPY